MVNQDLLAFKAQVRKFNVIINQIEKVWSVPQYKTYAVLLQNLGADLSQGSLSDKVVKCAEIVAVFRSCRDYAPHDHVVSWIYTEVDALFTGFLVGK